MQILHPPIKPYAEYRLKVEEPHELYLEESGSPDGIPVLVLHGGPGGSSEAFNRRFFDPQKFRIILYDQRGCGRSTPHASTQSNHTQALLEDIETIRSYLKIDKWMIVGGSWGATLGLLYAQAHPEKVLGLVLRGLFLCRPEDIEWFYGGGGASKIFPDAWKEFLRPVAKADVDGLFDAYLSKLEGPDELARMGAAKAWASWAGQCATLRPNHTVMDRYADPHMATSMAIIGCHYFKNKGFAEPNQILNNMDKIKEVPGIIIHGRYDMICPLDQAYQLHSAWGAADLNIVRDAGHAASDPGIVDAVVRAMTEMAKLLGRNTQA